VATHRADARIPKHTQIQAVTNPSEVATCSGTPNSRIVTRPEVSGGALRASRSVQESREWARSARERDADSIARLAEVGGPTWISTRLFAQELDTGASVDSTTPVLPEERRIPNDKRMEQDAHLARLARFAPLPLARLAQRAGAATANAGGIHHAQASISFSAVFVRNQLLVSRAPKRPIELASKVLAGKAACFPRRVAVVGGPYPDAGAEEAGRVVACELPDGRAGANSVVRTGIGSNWCPSSSRILQAHWLMICQASCQEAAWLHQRSGSCSLSSSASTVSKDPRCRYKSSTSLAQKAGAASLVTNNS